MKRILKKGIVSILIVLIIVNFISASTINVSYGIDLGDIFSGLIGLITWIPRAIMMAALVGLNKLMTAFAFFGLDGIDGYGLNDAIDPFGIADVSFLSPFHIFFNKIALLDVNFLNFTGLSGTVEVFRTAVAGWYYTMRLIACMILAVILIYIGIRMAISTIASEKAMYKKMLVDWMTSLALLFLLHYIMLFTFACNEALVKAIEAVCEEAKIDAVMSTLMWEALGIEIINAVASMILFGIIIGQTLSFLFAYVKRMLTIGFLIMIAPLITITYSIDKIGDGKAQALNTWLKEFVYNVLIQPFHCILFASFASVALQLITSSGLDDSNIAALILAICCLQFIKTGEELVKKIFGFGQATSLTTMAAGAAMTMAAINKGSSVGQTIGTGAAKAKNFLASNSDKIAKATGNLGNKISKRFDKFERDENGQIKRDAQGNAILSRKGRQKAESEARKKTGEKQSWESQDQYAARYQSNFESASRQMDLRQAEKQQRKVDRLVSKEKKSMRKQKERADKKREYEKKHGEGSYENRPTKRIGRAVGHVTDSVGGFIGEHRQELNKMQAGIVMATIGMGAGGMAGAFAGGKFGAGVVQGYMSNTDKTLQAQLNASAQAVQNMHEGEEDFDMEAKTYDLFETAQNGGLDKIQDKLDKILDKIAGLKADKKDRARADISRQLLQNPTGLNTDFLRGLVDKYGERDENGNLINEAGALNGLKQYTTLAAEANFAKAVTNATGTRSIQDVAKAASVIQQTTFVNNSRTYNVDNRVQQEVEQTIQTTSEGEVEAQARDALNQAAREARSQQTDASSTIPHQRDIPPTDDNQ